MATHIRRDEAAPAGITIGTVLALWRRPHRGWRAIERATAGASGVIVGWGMPLAAIRPAAGLVHDLAYGHVTTGIIEYRPTVGGAIVTAIIGWLLWTVALAVLAWAIGALAPRFGARPDPVAAAKAAVFGSSAFLVASVFTVVPAIAFLQVLGLYSLFLLAVGVPRLLPVAEERNGGGFGAAAAGVAIVLLVVVLLIVAAIAHRSLRPTVESAGHRVVVTHAPAIASTRLTAPESTRREAVRPGLADAGTVGASSLQALLPAAIGDFRRVAIQSQSSVTGGVATSSAQGTYVQGVSSFTLTITDAGSTGALSSTNSVASGTTNRVTDAGYEHSDVVGGVRIVEKWNNADHGGTYSRTVAGRFTVEAHGTAPTIATLRGAVASIDRAKLAALAR